MDRAQELRHLAQADDHIVAGEQRIARLQVLIDDFDARNCDTTQARRLMDSLCETMAEWVVHRNLILERLGQRH